MFDIMKVFIFSNICTKVEKNMFNNAIIFIKILA